MQVTVMGESKEIYVNTVTLQLGEGSDMYAFHCPNCGNFHQKIVGEVSKIYPFYEPSSQVPVISKCNKCDKLYNFQTHEGYSSERVKVMLNLTNEPTRFYCYRTKNRILEYSVSGMYSFVDNKVHKGSFFSACIHPECKVVYNFDTLN